MARGSAGGGMVPGQYDTCITRQPVCISCHVIKVFTDITDTSNRNKPVLHDLRRVKVISVPDQHLLALASSNNKI